MLRLSRSIFLILATSAFGTCFAQEAQFRFGSTPANEMMRDWHTEKFEGVVRQGLDYSCGAASIATILKHYWNQDVAEEEIINRMPIKLEKDYKGRFVGYNFEHMATAINNTGSFLSVMKALSLDELKSIHTIPGVVSLSIDGEPHFSVLRSINANGVVLLADSSWGNMTMTAEQFARAFVPSGQAEGRIMYILPKNPGAVRVSEDYVRSPRSWQSAFDLLLPNRRP